VAAVAISGGNAKAGEIAVQTSEVVDGVYNYSYSTAANTDIYGFGWTSAVNSYSNIRLNYESPSSSYFITDTNGMGSLEWKFVLPDRYVVSKVEVSYREVCFGGGGGWDKFWVVSDPADYTDVKTATVTDQNGAEQCAQWSWYPAWDSDYTYRDLTTNVQGSDVVYVRWVAYDPSGNTVQLQRDNRPFQVRITLVQGPVVDRTINVQQGELVDGVYNYSYDIASNADTYGHSWKKAAYSYSNMKLNVESATNSFFTPATPGIGSLEWKFVLPAGYVVSKAEVSYREVLFGSGGGWDKFWVVSDPADYIDSKVATVTDQNGAEQIAQWPWYGAWDSDYTYRDVTVNVQKSDTIYIKWVASDPAGGTVQLQRDNRPFQVRITAVPGTSLTKKDVTVTLDNFEADALTWVYEEPTADKDTADLVSVSKQTAEVYAGAAALDFQVVRNLSEGGEWALIKGLLPAGKNWTYFQSVTFKIKTSVAGAIPYLYWDFLIDGTDKANRVNGSDGCGFITPAANTDWQTFTVDLGSFSRSNVTGFEFYIYTGWLASIGTYDIYIDDIKLNGRAISGDANMDGVVNVSDLSLLAANYGTASGASWANGDFDGNGAVGVSDLSILAANYNSGSASTVSWAEAYAQAFGTTATDETATDTTESTVCSSLGLSLIAGFALMGLLLVKLEE
jgi:hypothetical protein